MKIILDEQLDPALADVLNVLQKRHGCTFISLRHLAPPKTQDIELPEICRKHGAVALGTADVKDFGAKRVYFEALLEAGVSVVTPGPQKRIHVLESQTALLVQWSREVAEALRAAKEPLLLRVNNSGVSPRSLQELIEEVQQVVRVSPERPARSVRGAARQPARSLRKDYHSRMGAQELERAEPGFASE